MSNRVVIIARDSRSAKSKLYDLVGNLPYNLVEHLGNFDARLKDGTTYHSYSKNDIDRIRGIKFTDLYIDNPSCLDIPEYILFSCSVPHEDGCGATVTYF